MKGNSASAIDLVAPAQVRLLDRLEWSIAADPKNIGRDERWFEAPVAGAKPARVPGALQEYLPGYHGLVWYWTRFDAPANPDPQGRYLLRFWSVDYHAQVWVNGQPAGEHQDPEEPFTLDVTAAVRAGGENLLAVRVLNPSAEAIDGISFRTSTHGAKVLPHHPGLEWNFGGILDSVELLVAPALRVDELHLRPDWRSGEIRMVATVYSARPHAASAELRLSVAPASGGETVAAAVVRADVPPGQSELAAVLRVADHRLWDLDDPFLYRVRAQISGGDGTPGGELSARCGFRHFEFRDGYFRLNGRRIFLRSAHSLWTTPIKLHSSQDLAMLRRDVIYARTMGFNMIRFLPFAGARCQLDLCDELGMMVMQQSASSWKLDEWPGMPQAFDRSLLGIVRRDRNHPCVALWYFLNETRDGAVFRHAVQALPKVRAIDPDRMCMLSSGRWDKDWSIGSLSNPGSATWDESTLGDVHHYLDVPHRKSEIDFLRGDMHWEKGPVLLSEYGVASAIDLVGFTRYYEQRGAAGSMDGTYYRQKLEQFMGDWERWKLAEIFGRPEDYFRACLAANAPQRLLGISAIRSNPRAVGYSMTALHDEVSCGEGPITFLRDLKPGVVDAIRTGFAPLKWNLFVEPWHVRQGGTVRAEVVLANEDALPAGDYQVEIIIFDPDNRPVLKETVPLAVGRSASEPPMALPVWSNDVRIDGPAGRYRLTASFVSGAMAADGQAEFHVCSADDLPAVRATVGFWGDDPELETWLRERQIAFQRYNPGDAARPQVVLASGRLPVGADTLTKLHAYLNAGGSMVVLTPSVSVAAAGTPANTSGTWTVFERFERSAPEPDLSQLTRIPAALELGGVQARRHEVKVDVTGRLDLIPVWGGNYLEKVAYVYIPFSVAQRGSYAFWFGADWWYKAWIDGKPISDTLATGNGEPPAAMNHSVRVDLEAGEHLLVVKFISGTDTCLLYVGGPMKLTEEYLRLHPHDSAVSKLHWLPVGGSGKFGGLDVVAGFYHRDDWVRRHPIFDGLPSGGLMDWTFFRQIVPHGGVCLKGLQPPDEAVSGAIQTCCGYDAGLYVAVYRIGAGRMVLNCLQIRENLAHDLVAERILRNMLNYAASPVNTAARPCC